jgi:hypothetical protein
VDTTEVGDVDERPPGGASGKVRQRPPPKLETSKAAPLGGDGGKVRQWPPPKLKMGRGGCWRQGPATATTEVEDVDGGPLGVLVGRSDSGHHRSCRRRWRAPWGCWRQGPAATTTKDEDIDGGPQEVRELEIREHSAFGARPSGRVVNGCRNLRINAQRVVRTHFALLRLGTSADAFLVAWTCRVPPYRGR